MSRMLLVVLVVLAVFTSNSYADGCGPNEEYKECGTACEPTCKEPDNDVCTLQCKSGCFCKDGYLRNDDRECVLPADCENSA